jgi:hypothetical protein
MRSVDHLDGGRRGACGLYVANWVVWDFLSVVGTDHIWRGGEEVDRAKQVDGGPGTAKDGDNTHCSKRVPSGLWTGNQG